MTTGRGYLGSAELTRRARLYADAPIVGAPATRRLILDLADWIDELSNGTEPLYVCTLCHSYGPEAWVYTSCFRNSFASAPGQNAGHECDPLVDVIAAAYGSGKPRSGDGS